MAHVGQATRMPIFDQCGLLGGGIVPPSTEYGGELDFVRYCDCRPLAIRYDTST